MKKILSILTIIARGRVSCNKSNETENAYNLYAGLEFSIFNSQNEDLLDPENPYHTNEANIRVFYVVDGETQEVYNSNADNPINFMIYKYVNEYRIGLSLNYTETEEKPITYIQCNENDTNTIEVLYDRAPNAVIQNKIWLNGKQVRELGDNTIDPYFVLEKQLYSRR